MAQNACAIYWFRGFLFIVVIVTPIFPDINPDKLQFKNNNWCKFLIDRYRRRLPNWIKSEVWSLKNLSKHKPQENRDIIKMEEEENEKFRKIIN